MDKVERAMNEVKRAFDEDDCWNRKMANQVMELFRLFDSFGNNYLISNYVLTAFIRLAKQLPITPLTGEDDEWICLYMLEDNRILFQNKRCPRVFKCKSSNGKQECFLQEQIIFKNEHGETYFRGKDSNLPIENFPFEVPDEYTFVYREDDDARF